jgi:hypothetical protein
MAALDIPEEYQDGLAELSALSDDAFNELASALETAAFALRHRALAANVISKVESIPKDQIEQIVEMLVSMNIVRRHADVNETEFVEDVYEAITESDDAPEFITEQEESFKKRLTRLLAAKSLEVVSKAQSVILDHERRFCTVRIATDVSPVFSSDAQQPPMAAVITHTLRISFHQDSNDIKEFFVEMNEGDLEKLTRSIQRAEQKAKGLKSVLDAAKLPYLE